MSLFIVYFFFNLYLYRIFLEETVYLLFYVFQFLPLLQFFSNNVHLATPNGWITSFRFSDTRVHIMYNLMHAMLYKAPEATRGPQAAILAFILFYLFY